MQANSPIQASTTGTLSEFDQECQSLRRCIEGWRRKTSVEQILLEGGVAGKLNNLNKSLKTVGGHLALDIEFRQKLDSISNLVDGVIAERCNPNNRGSKRTSATDAGWDAISDWLKSLGLGQRSSSAAPQPSTTAVQRAKQPVRQGGRAAAPQGPAARGGTRPPPAASAGSGTGDPGAQAPTTRTLTPQKKVLASLASNINGWLDRDKKYKGVVKDHASDRNLARSLQRLNEILKSLGGYSILEKAQRDSLKNVRPIVAAILEFCQKAEGTPWNCQIKMIASQVTFVHDWIRLAGLDPPSSSAPSEPPATEGQERGQHRSRGRQTATSQRPAPQGRIWPPKAFAGSGTHAPHNRHASNGQAINPGLRQPNNPGGRLPPIGDVFTPAELGELQAPYGRPPVVTSNGPSNDWGSRRPGDAAPPALPVPIAGAQGGLPTNLAAILQPQQSHRQSQRQFPPRMQLADSTGVYPPILENPPPPRRVRTSHSRSPSRERSPDCDYRSDRWRV